MTGWYKAHAEDVQRNVTGPFLRLYRTEKLDHALYLRLCISAHLRWCLFCRCSCLCQGLRLPVNYLPVPSGAVRAGLVPNQWHLSFSDLWLEGPLLSSASTQ